MMTLKEKIMTHSNNYGSSVATLIASGEQETLPELSIIVPYYEVGALFRKSLDCLRDAIHAVQAQHASWSYEIIIIDDGSRKYPLLNIISTHYSDLNIRTKIFPKNLGRAEARQAGLHMAIFPFVTFMDADILVESYLLLDHMRVHANRRQNLGRNAITITFFEFLDNDEKVLKERLSKPLIVKPNDFRLECVFQATWKLGERDEEFIDQHIFIVDDTNEFRSWKGWFKAWLLPNMILGGFFTCNREDALSVGGFDTKFSGYGFTETTLPSRLIAQRENFVIPITSHFALHIDDPSINLSRYEKDRLLQEKYAYYHNVFLMQEAK